MLILCFSADKICINFFVLYVHLLCVDSTG